MRLTASLHPDDGDGAWAAAWQSIGNNTWLAAAWCVTITVVGYVWAKNLYNRDPSR